MTQRTDDLKASTRFVHRETERHEMVRIMLKGECDAKTYAIYLWNIGLIYAAMEQAALQKQLIGQSLCRAQKIREDFNELWSVVEKTRGAGQKPPVFQSTRRHLDRISAVKQDDTLLMAHIYVRHLGDLHGGQILRHKVPGSATFYAFEDSAAAIGEIHSRLNDKMHEEAVLGFEFARQVFDDVLQFGNSDDVG